MTGEKFLEPWSERRKGDLAGAVNLLDMYLDELNLAEWKSGPWFYIVLSGFNVCGNAGDFFFVAAFFFF